jgi:hypothetical protein
VHFSLGYFSTRSFLLSLPSFLMPGFVGAFFFLGGHPQYGNRKPHFRPVFFSILNANAAPADWRGKANSGHIRDTNYRSFSCFRLMDLAALPENRAKDLLM